MSTESIEIPRNTYKVECDEKTKSAIKWAVERFSKGEDSVTFINDTGTSSGPAKGISSWYYTNEAIAREVARNFVASGYHAALDRFVTGYFANLEISRKPISCGYSAEILG